MRRGRSNTNQDDHLSLRLEAVAARLGYVGSATFVTADGIGQERVPYVTRQAITTIGVYGVLSLEDGFVPARIKPIVYLASACNEDEVRDLRRLVWSQGVVPFLIVVTPDTVKICNAFGSPDTAVLDIPFDPGSDELPASLANFSRARISSSVTWGNFELHRNESVDNVLVDAIESLNDRARHEFPEFESDKDLINALIGKFIYLYVLVDRAILTKSWLAGKLYEASRPNDRGFVDAVFDVGVHQQRHEWTASTALAAFDIIDDAINGSIFAIKENQKARIPDELCRIIHRAIRGGETMHPESSQPGFFDVSFNVLRTETISAIYERFVSIEDSERKKDDGVFYTPPHLADHVLDRLEAVKPFTPASRIVDPAAGSGIFLVGAYRRLLENNAPVDGWSPMHIGLARDLLVSSIHGIEKHPQAANVCRFSLYLTLLEYVGRATIEELIAAAGSTKFLPDLSRNIVCADAFSLPAANVYTHVVGNPPWSMSGGQRDRANRGGGRKEIAPELEAFKAELRTRKISFAHDRLCDLFTWLALVRLAAPDGAVALIINAKSVIGRHANNFAHCLGRRATVRWTGNLSHLRRKLFDGGDASAFVLVAVNRMPTGSDRVAIYRPLLSSLPAGRKQEIWSLLASQADIQIQRSQDLRSGPNGWFTQTMLSQFDRRMRDALATWSTADKRTFGDLIARSKLSLSKGRSPAESGAARTGRDESDPKLHPLTVAALGKVADRYRGLFAGNVILIPRSMKKATYRLHPTAYSSTFNGLIRSSQIKDLENGLPARYETEKFDPRFVSGLIAYLNSTVVRYFASLFGASFFMDQARLELNDLICMPCPFESMDDPRLLGLGESGDVDEAILDAMEAGKDFRRVFQEFATFRIHFGNCRTPKDSLSRPSQETIDAYVTRLRDEIQASFGSSRIVRVAVREIGDSRCYVSIAIGPDAREKAEPDGFEGQFLANSIVTFDAGSETSSIVKSPARSAWTIDQAVSDAAALGREMRGVEA